MEPSTALVSRDLTKNGGFGAKNLLVSLGTVSPKQGKWFILKWHSHFRNDRYEKVKNY